MFNKDIATNFASAKKVIAAGCLSGIVLTSAIAQASSQIVVKGTQCHPSSPVGFCCPNDGRASGPYCPDRRVAPRTQN